MAKRPKNLPAVKIAIALTIAFTIFAQSEVISGAQVKRGELVSRMRTELVQSLATTGRLREGSKKVRFKIEVQGEKLFITLPDLGKAFKADLKGNDISEITPNGTRKLSTEEIQAEIGGTGMGLDDISLQFIFWEHHSDGPGIKIRGKDCVGVNFQSPDDQAKFRTYTIWYDDTGLFQRACGFLKDGTMGRQIDVMSTQKAQGKWYLKSVRMVSAGFKRIAYVDFDPPHDPKGE